MTPHRLVLLAYFGIFAVSAGPLLPCLDDCICEQDERNPVIRCENGDRTELRLPSMPLSGYEIIALPCNNIVNLPSSEMLRVAFPQLKALDVEGNPSFNCSQIDSLRSSFVINSDCGNEHKFDCSAQDKDCDWKCRMMDKLRKMWKEFKDTVNRKAKDWGADESLRKVQNWFSNTYSSIANQFGA